MSQVWVGAGGGCPVFQIHLLGIASFLNPPRPEKPCHAMPSVNEELGRIRLDLVWLCGYHPIFNCLAGKLDGFFAGLSGWLTVGLLMDSSLAQGFGAELT